MRIGKPGMQRNERDLHGEGCKESEEQKTLDIERQRCPEQLLVGERRVAADGEVHVENRHEHEQRSRKGEQEELHRRIDAVAVPPHSVEQVHRDERDLPEQIEQEHVERREDAEHPRLESEKKDEELSLIHISEPTRLRRISY